MTFPKASSEDRRTLLLFIEANLSAGDYYQARPGEGAKNPGKAGQCARSALYRDQRQLGANDKVISRSSGFSVKKK